MESILAIDMHNGLMRRSERYVATASDDGLWRDAAQIMMLKCEIRKKAA